MMQRWSKTSRLIMGLGALLGLAIMAGCGGSSSSTPPGGNAVLNGRVLDAAGKPVPGVRITVAGRTATTDANGNYRLTGLPNTGTWSVSASKAGYQTFNTTVPAGTSSLPITLVPGTGATATLTGKVTDRVTGQAIAGAKLAVGNLSATSAADGTYRLAGVPAAADFTLVASRTGYETLSQTVRSGTRTANVQLVKSTDGPPAPPVFPN
ncbi:MAG TPA: hypothetical protein DCZ72_07760 [Armatimonadetes bacterium]|nr:hypothetical protein [Armatimonadota bacterium]